MVLTSAGAPAGNKVTVIALAVVSVVFVLPLAGVIAYAFSRFGGAFAVIGPLLMGVFVLGLLFAVVWGLVRVHRMGALLEGTELTVRPGAFTTRRVDLATAAQLRLTNHTGWSVSSPIPFLYAGGDAQGRTATVVFGRARNGYLPLPEVEALVATIRAGAREGVVAQQAEQAVQELYLRAAVS